MLNKEPILSTVFIDSFPLIDTNYYFVKTVKLSQSASGNYFNLSHGATVFINGIIKGGAGIEITNISDTKLYPNPVKTFLTLDLKGQSCIEKIEIYNSLGQFILSLDSKFDNYSMKSTVDLNLLSPGIYFIKSGNVIQKIIKE